MKITNVKVLPVNQFLFVKIYTDEGIVGLGESGAWGLLQASGAVVDTLFREYLIGKDPLQIERHWQFMVRADHFRGAAIMGAISAIDIALWDIAGKYYNAPVYKLLGGKYRNKVRCYCHVRGRTVEELLRKCELSQKSKYTAVGHISPFLDEPIDQIYNKSYSKRITDAAEVIGKVREAVGNEVDICVESHRQMKPAEAVVLAKELEPFHPYFLEDPIPPDNFDAMSEVASKINIPIATGERINTLQEFQMLVSRKAVQFLRTDICLCGGFTGAKKIAAIAEANDVQLAPHNPLSPVSTAANVQFAACTPSLAILEYPDDMRMRIQPDGSEKFLLSDIVTNIDPCTNGYLEVQDAPGIGIDLVEDAERKYPYSQYPVQMRSVVDGSLMDN